MAWTSKSEDWKRGYRAGLNAQRRGEKASFPDGPPEYPWLVYRAGKLYGSYKTKPEADRVATHVRGCVDLHPKAPDADRHV